MTEVSIIVSVYENPRWLKLILAALKHQTRHNFEVVVADDGSGDQIAEVVRLHAGGFPIKHVWHEDNGWRKNIILNKAIEASSSDYLIFIDGDCVPHRTFIAEHMRYRSPDTVMAGRRCDLPPQVSDKLDVDKVEKRGMPCGLFCKAIYYSL